MMRLSNARSVSRRLRDGMIEVHCERGDTALVIAFTPDAWARLVAFAAREACCAPALQLIDAAGAHAPASSEHR
jgi:hypothetical protein